MATRRERHAVLTELGREVARKIAAAIRDPKPVRKKPSTHSLGQTLTTPYRGSYGSGAIASVTLTEVWKTRACFNSSQDTDDWVPNHLSRRALGTVAGALAKVPRAAIQYQGACTCPLLLNKPTLWVVPQAVMTEAGENRCVLRLKKADQ
jgi:hypothetical protein